MKKKYLSVAMATAITVNVTPMISNAQFIEIKSHNDRMNESDIMYRLSPENSKKNINKTLEDRYNFKLDWKALKEFSEPIKLKIYGYKDISNDSDILISEQDIALSKDKLTESINLPNKTRDGERIKYYTKVLNDNSEFAINLRETIETSEDENGINTTLVVYSIANTKVDVIWNDGDKKTHDRPEIKVNYANGVNKFSTVDEDDNIIDDIKLPKESKTIYLRAGTGFDGYIESNSFDNIIDKKDFENYKLGIELNDNKYRYELTGNAETGYKLIIRNAQGSYRISGRDRIDTSIEISKKYFNDVDTVIVANAHKYADILSAVPYAKLLKSPILYTYKNSITDDTIQELKRLGAKKVIICGGTDSVSGLVSEKIIGNSIEVERVSGVDRYDTSVKISKVVKIKNRDANSFIIADGENFPDAISAANIASRDAIPILLTKKTKLPEPVKLYIDGENYKNNLICGGKNSVSEEIAKYLSKKMPTERVGGIDRYQTAYLMAAKAYRNPREVFIASGELFADSLSIAAISGIESNPILLTTKNKLNPWIINYINDNKVKNYKIIGGESVISNEVEKLVIEAIFK